MILLGISLAILVGQATPEDRARELSDAELQATYRVLLQRKARLQGLSERSNLVRGLSASAVRPSNEDISQFQELQDKLDSVYKSPAWVSLGFEAKRWLQVQSQVNEDVLFALSHWDLPEAGLIFSVSAQQSLQLSQILLMDAEGGQDILTLGPRSILPPNDPLKVEIKRLEGERARTLSSLYKKLIGTPGLVGSSIVQRGVRHDLDRQIQSYDSAILSIWISMIGLSLWEAWRQTPKDFKRNHCARAFIALRSMRPIYEIRRLAKQYPRVSRAAKWGLAIALTMPSVYHGMRFGMNSAEQAIQREQTSVTELDRLFSQLQLMHPGLRTELGLRIGAGLAVEESNRLEAGHVLAQMNADIQEFERRWGSIKSAQEAVERNLPILEREMVRRSLVP